MSHATPSFSFISPVISPAGEAEAALCPRLIVSAINSRPLVVYLRMFAVVRYAQRNLSRWLMHWLLLFRWPLARSNLAKDPTMNNAGMAASLPDEIIRQRGVRMRRNHPSCFVGCHSAGGTRLRSALELGLQVQPNGFARS